MKVGCPPVTRNRVAGQDSYFPQFDAVAAEHVVPGIRHVLQQLGSNLDSLEAGVAPSWEGLVEPLERMTDQLSRAWGVVSHLKVGGLCWRLDA